MGLGIHTRQVKQLFTQLQPTSSTTVADNSRPLLTNTARKEQAFVVGRYSSVLIEARPCDSKHRNRRFAHRRPHKLFVLARYANQVEVLLAIIIL